MKPRTQQGITRQKQVAECIMDAATLIRKRGFCVGALNDDSGRLCLMGAIRQTALANHLPKGVKYSAYDAVNKVLRRPIHEWNDEQTETERVAALLEGVAKRVYNSVSIREVCYQGHVKSDCVKECAE